MAQDLRYLHDVVKQCRNSLLLMLKLLLRKTFLGNMRNIRFHGPNVAFSLGVQNIITKKKYL